MLAPKGHPIPQSLKKSRVSHTGSPHPVKVIHTQMHRRLQKDVGNSMREPLPIVPWNNLPWKWETGPQTFAVTQPADTFQIFYCAMDSLIMLHVARAFLSGVLFLNATRVQKVELIISPVHNILLSLVYVSPTYLFIYPFIQFILICSSFYSLFSFLNLSFSQASIICCWISSPFQRILHDVYILYACIFKLYNLCFSCSFILFIAFLSFPLSVCWRFLCIPVCTI